MLMEQLKELEDARSYHGKEYLLHDILYCTILALLSGAKGYTDIGRFIEVHFEKLKKFLGLKWRRPPDPSAIRKIIIRVDAAELEKVFRSDAANLIESKTIVQSSEQEHNATKQICFDGKSLRGSFSHLHDKRAKGVFSAFAAGNKIVLAHMDLGDDKEHEIPALQQFLLSLNLRGVIVTADAMHCQKKLSNVQKKPEQF